MAPVISPATPAAWRKTGGESEGAIPPVIPTGDRWDLTAHVLCTSSFPSCLLVRNRLKIDGKQFPSKNREGRGTCSCTPDETHRDFFGFCRQIVAPAMRDDKPIPEVKVCWNAENLFECKLDRRLTGRKDRVKFSELATVREAQSVLYQGTFWYPRLIRGKEGGAKHSRNGLALLRLLGGLKSYSGKEHIGKLCERRLSKGGVNKLRSILAVIDGLLMQLVICFPNRKAYLNWESLDQIVHCMLCNLLPDYFSNEVDKETFFEKVKRLRKAIKKVGFNPLGDLSDIDIPQEMSFFERALSFINQQKRPVDLYSVATLSQTRASGVPPRSVYLKTMLKIKTVLQEQEDPSVYEGVRALIRPSVVSIHNKVLDRLGSETQISNFWSNCLEKAKISLSDSGEFFTNSESGGKLEACRKVLSQLREIPVRNLHTGQIESIVPIDSIPIGEAIFQWACERFSDRNACYDRNLMSVRISLVAELGKYRAITVSHLAHAVLLHVLSHVLLGYLEAIPSSQSGVKAANHAWNFFKRLSHKNPNANFIFGDKDVYLFSTDWEQATDFTNQSIAQSILTHLCDVLGIPRWYAETCIFALCAPRQVEQIDPEGKTLECFFTTRGELMGDPVTKVILHYHHLVARESTLMVLDEARGPKEFSFEGD